MDHEKIEVPVAFDADCDKCFLKCSVQEMEDKRPQCIRARTAYIEGYKAAACKFDDYRHLETRVVVYNPVTDRDETFLFVGVFGITEGTRFILDTSSGRYGQGVENRLLADVTVRDRLRLCTLKKLEIKVVKTLVVGHGGTIRLEGLDGKETEL